MRFFTFLISCLGKGVVWGETPAPLHFFPPENLIIKMPPPSWAFQVENFHPPPDEELVCSVCQGVFNDPVQSQCNHVFCRGCLFKWLETNHNCPICRKRTRRYHVTDVVPLVKNMIMKLVMRCRNWDKCSETFALEACEAHMLKCGYEMVQCKHRRCKLKFLRKEVRDHELNACPHRTLKCSKCEMKVPAINQNSHNCLVALKRKLKSQDSSLKKKNDKIKELKKEVERLEELQQQMSRASSHGSVSAADILIDLDDLPSFSTASSHSRESSLYYESETFDNEWFDFLNDSEDLDSTVNTIEEDEYPHDFAEFAPAPTSELLSDPNFLNVNEESVPRRPAKRRRPVQVLDSSEEDNAGFHLPSLASPKRSWNLFQRDPEASEPVQLWHSRRNSESTAGPSHASYLGAAAGSKAERSNATAVRRLDVGEAAGPSCTASNPGEQAKDKGNDASARPKDNTETKKRACAQTSVQRSQHRTTNLPARPAANPVFERTIAMLRQYNLESDEEWLPRSRRHVKDPSSDSSEEETSSRDDSLLEETSVYSDSDSFYSSDDEIAFVRPGFFSSLPDDSDEEPVAASSPK